MGSLLQLEAQFQAITRFAAAAGHHHVADRFDRGLVEVRIHAARDRADVSGFGSLAGERELHYDGSLFARVLGSFRVVVGDGDRLHHFVLAVRGRLEWRELRTYFALRVERFGVDALLRQTLDQQVRAAPRDQQLRARSLASLGVGADVSDLAFALERLVGI